MNKYRVIVLLPVLGLLAGSGCGLNEYESRMEYTKKRLEFLEEANRYLAAPVTWPAKVPVAKGQRPFDIPTSDFFFRPPRGIQSEGKNDPLAPLLFRCPPVPVPPPGPIGAPVPASAANMGNVGFLEVYFGVTRGNFAQYKKDVIACWPEFSGKTETYNVERGPGRAPVPFERLSYTDKRGAYRQLVFFTQQEQYGVAIVYFVAPGVKDEAIKTSLNYSLGSLAVGYQAYRQYQAYTAQSAQ